MLLAAAIVVYVLPSARAILDDGDALYSTVAAEMISRNDWVTPQAGGVRFLDKPPLMYWLVALSYLVFGVSEWAARLPAAIGIFATALMLAYLGRRVAGDDRAGIVAGLIFILSAGTLFFTLEAFPDIFLVVCLTGAVLCFLELHCAEKQSVWAAAGLGAALAGATLSKSLIGIFFPLATIAAFLFVERKRPRVTWSHMALIAAVFVGIALPWHVIAAARNPGFLYHYFVNEQILRFFGRREPVDYGSIPAPIFWALLLVWLFPWSAFLPATWRLPGGDENRSAIIRMSWCWAGVVIGFFTLSSRLEHYSFPALPPLALLIGIALADTNRKSMSRSFTALAMLGVVLGLAAAGIGVWWNATGAEMFAGAEAGARSRAYTNLFSPLFELPAETRAKLIWPLVGALGVFAAGTAAAWLWERRGNRLAAFGSLAAMMAVFCLLALYSLRLCEGLLSSKPFGLALKDRKGAQVIVCGDYESANSILFYAPVRLLLYEGRADSIAAGLRYDDAPKMMITREEVDVLRGGEVRVYLLGTRKQIEDLGWDASRAVLGQGGRLLVVNR
ncbi:MAG: glycosyltransferase family 39 protein [Blastocatellales bacterium]|nr:glycosyltransferase family 39 protein [Blastocatellales bacterium]